MELTRLLVGKPYRNPAFIAGHIYSFVSNESVDLGEIPTQQELDDKKKSRYFLRTQTYFDRSPVCIPILHEDHRDFELIINLKVLPLENLRKLVIPLAKRGELEKTKEGVYESLTLKNADKPLSVLSLRIAENLAGIPLAPYLNKYYRKNIINPKHIGWDEVGKVLMIDWSNDTGIKTNTFTDGRIS